MNSYVFMTDSDSDLPCQFVDQYDLKMVYMPYMIDGVEYFDDLGRAGKQAEYFENMRKGVSPVTSPAAHARVSGILRAYPCRRPRYSVYCVLQQNVLHDQQHLRRPVKSCWKSIPSAASLWWIRSRSPRP